MTYSVSNSRITLSLPSSINSYFPGSILYPSLALHGSSDYTSLTLHLLGTTTANIMGKDRWQAGAMANLGSGGSPMLITSIEKNEFLDIAVPLVSSSNARLQGEKGDTKKNKGGEESAGMYEVTLPMSSIGILPSVNKKEDDAAGVGIKYYFEVRGTRKGLFHSNDKLQLEFKVVFPMMNHSILPRSLSIERWPSEVHTIPLKFKNDSTSGTSLQLTATLSHLPPSTTSDPIPFYLSLTSCTNGLSLFSSSPSPPTVLVSLARRVHTEPVKDPESGKPFDWAGIRLVKGSLERIGDGMKWKGQVVVPQGQVSVESKGLRIHYVLTCQITSPILEKDLIVKAQLFLPSADHTIEGAVASGSGDGTEYDYGGPPPPSIDEAGSGLPSYSA